MIKIYPSLILFLILITQNLTAQVSKQWQFYGDTPEESQWIIADSHDNVYTLGRYGGLRKYNHFGDTIFYVTDTASGFVPNNIAIDSDDHIVIIGSYNQSPGSQVILVQKFDTSGNRLWALPINTPNGNEEYPTSLTFDQNMDIYITGWDGDQFFGRYYSAKINAAGVFQWGNSYNQGQIWDPYFGKDIAVSNPNVIYSTGFVYENGTTNDMIIIRYNQAGDTVWTRKFSYYHYYGGQWTTEDQGTQVEADQYGNAYVLSTNVSDHINVLIKYDSLGNRQWVKRPHTSPTNIVNMILYNDEIYLGGNMDTGAGMGTPVAAKLDLTGTAIFNNTYPNLGVTITDMERYNDGIVMTGNSYTCNGCNWDGFTLYFDGAGNPAWYHVMDTENGMSTDQPYGITTDHSGGIYVTGNGHGSWYWMNTYKLYPCNEIQPIVTHNGSVHTANYISGAAYTWRDCSNDSVVASGIELNQYTQTYSGDFAVEISVGTCSDSSSCITAGTGFVSNRFSYSIFPNPASDVINIEGHHKTIQCMIYSIDGRELKSILLRKDEQVIDVSDLDLGVYILSIGEKQNFVKYRIVKDCGIGR